MEKAVNPTTAKRLTDPREIEREIQRQIAASSASRTKASLFNLVIFRRLFATDPSAEALGYLLGRRPARLILIESGSTNPSEAFVSARCHPDPKNVELCFQEVRIQDGPDAVGRAPGFWSPLLIRDIPVFVWWLEAIDLLPALLPGIVPFADRFLADSGFAEEQGTDAGEALRGLADGARAHALPLSDFSWHRLHPLRLAAARLFEPPAARDLLQRIRAVHLQGGRRAEALLLFHWLAARLGWTPAPAAGAAAGAPAVPRTRRLEMHDASGTAVRLVHEQPRRLEAGFALQFELVGGRTLGLECPGGNNGFARDADSSNGPGPAGGQDPGSAGDLGTDGLSDPQARCGLLRGLDGTEEHLEIRVPGPGEILLRTVDSRAPDPMYTEVLDLLARDLPKGGNA